ARERVHRVAHARRVRRVVAAFVAEIVVGEVADHVRGHEPGEHEDEGERVEAPRGEREQAGDDRRLRGDDEDDAARRIEKLGRRIQVPDFLHTRTIEAGKGAEPQGELRSTCCGPLAHALPRKKKGDIVLCDIGTQYWTLVQLSGTPEDNYNPGTSGGGKVHGPASQK